MIVSSGTAGHVHSYWILHPPLGAIEMEQANRTLAGHLGGDLASVDAARILRPAGTLSHKYRPPVRVELLHLDPTVRYESAELLEGLTAAPSRSKLVAGTRARAGRTDLDERLLAIPAARYVRELAGLEARRDGKVNCPFHPDDTPSLQLYEDGTFYCYGCGTGGSVYDFAATLWLAGRAHDGTWKLRGASFCGCASGWWRSSSAARRSRTSRSARLGDERVEASDAFGVAAASAGAVRPGRKAVDGPVGKVLCCEESLAEGGHQVGCG